MVHSGASAPVTENTVRRTSSAEAQALPHMNVRESTMSLRCSLLGHSYGESEIEREREEQGSEVVVTVREFEECRRCGNRKVVTENKEVTALDSTGPERGAGGPAAGTDASTTGIEAGASSATGAGTDTGATTGDDAEIVTGSGPSTPSGQPSASGVEAGDGTTAATAGTDHDGSGASDDGVILDDGAEPTDDREPGEWPEADSTHPEETEETSYPEWPDVGTEDEGYDAVPGGGGADVEFGGGLTPESAPEVDAEEAEEVEFVNAEGDALTAREPRRTEPELSSGISARTEAPSLSGPAETPDVDAEFVCPECDYREAVAGSSLRAGDICPVCARGYLAQE